MVMEALEERALGLVEMALLPVHLTAVLHLTQVYGEVVLPGHKGRRLLIEGHSRIPHRQTSGIEPVEGPDVVDPFPHPRGQLGPTPRRVEKIAADMRPAIGQD